MNWGRKLQRRAYEGIRTSTVLRNTISYHGLLLLQYTQRPNSNLVMKESITNT
jgi:hypothetical protein